MDTPTDTPVEAGLSASTYVAVVAPNEARAAGAVRPLDPDNPPWGVPAAAFVWLASIGLLFIVPTLAGIGYVISRLSRMPFGKVQETLLTDPHFILISVAAVIPAHLLTIWLVWWLVTHNGRRSFRDLLGLRWSPRGGALEVFAWGGVVALLFVCNAVIGHYFKGGDTDLEKIIASSLAARYLVVVLATCTAPLVEETVYRGVLYPALRRAAGTFVACFVVAGLFALVHVWQYRANIGVIAAISLLSVTLTLVRALTRRLLPCLIIHTLFNFITSIAIVSEQYIKQLPPSPAPTGALIWSIMRAAGLNF